jgi:hypothetical protein
MPSNHGTLKNDVVEVVEEAVTAGSCTWPMGGQGAA